MGYSVYAAKVQNEVAAAVPPLGATTVEIIFTLTVREDTLSQV